MYPIDLLKVAIPFPSVLDRLLIRTRLVCKSSTRRQQPCTPVFRTQSPQSPE